MTHVIDHHSLLHLIDTQAPELPDLQKVIERWHGSRIRRIDRYIQLCVGGGLACVGERSLPEKTGVYLSTRCGAVSTSARVMTHVEADGDPPKPLHFVNTLGNSAAFYLTQSLGVTGVALVISQESLSFEAALIHALLDLNTGRTDTALVGGFDEVALPVHQQLQRLEAPADSPALFEGSHWLLLSNRASVGIKLSQPLYLTTLDELVRWLADHTGVPLQWGFLPNDAERAAVPQAATFQDAALQAGTVPHGVFSGAALVALAARGEPGIHIAKSARGHYLALTMQR